MTRSARRTSRGSLRPTTYCGTPRSARRMTSSARPLSTQARRVRAARGAPMLRAAGACPRRRRSASSAPFSVAETAWRASLGATRATPPSSSRREAQAAAWPAAWLAARTAACPSVARPWAVQPSAACPSALELGLRRHHFRRQQWLERASVCCAARHKGRRAGPWPGGGVQREDRRGGLLGRGQGPLRGAPCGRWPPYAQAAEPHAALPRGVGRPGSEAGAERAFRPGLSL
mmetsp:Transcript_25967/g.78435  ORF Transcript_25967/g.78435 Transcript_25967/m.78435 type:complete len:232 (-) Transcript_25967:495-1190(-)